jgi:hypothetical protein
MSNYQWESLLTAIALAAWGIWVKWGRHWWERRKASRHQ